MNVTSAAAVAVIKMVNGQITSETRVYPTYIKENSVTAETVAEHVKALTEAAYPGVKRDKRAAKSSKEYRASAFETKVRNGLNRNLPAVEAAKEEVDYLKRLIAAAEAAQSHGVTAAQIKAALSGIVK